MIQYDERLIERAKKIEKEETIASLISSLEKDFSHNSSVLSLLNELSFSVMDMGISLLDDSHRKFLSEIILEEKPEFRSNNLILAPAGSGKTTLIKNVLIDPQMKDKFLFLNVTRIEDDNETMTYQEFKINLKQNPDFSNHFDYILCDNFHLFLESNKDLNLIEFLLSKHENKQIFYFATNKIKFSKLKKHYPNLIENVEVYDYMKHNQIKKYMDILRTEIENISEINEFFNRIENTLNYNQNYKGLAIGDNLEDLENLDLTLKEYGVKPIVLWSKNEFYKEHTEEQKNALNYLTETKKIPNDCNLLIISKQLKQEIEIEDINLKYSIISKNHEKDGVLGKNRHCTNLVVYNSTYIEELEG